MTGTSSSRRYQFAVLAIALGAFLLRVFPFFGADGAWSYRVDYDEGVYFSAASFLLEGVLPYRDYVFVHPPGLLVFLAATSAWTHAFLGVDGAFALSRWIAAGIGTLNVLLVARLVSRWPDAKWGALFAAAFYATYPELVAVERGPFLEPLLNLVCLAMALAVLHAAGRTRWLCVAGALAGVAVSIKLWAVLWVVGALWAIGDRRGTLIFLGAAALVFGLVVAPFALQAPENFLTEAVRFHGWRPPDGVTDRLPRLEQIFAFRHLASPLLALLMLVLLLARRSAWNAESRVMVPAWALTLAAFFASPSYWTQYNAHLIASEAVLAGALLSLVPRNWTRVIGVALLLSLGVSTFQSIRRARGDDSHLLLARSSLRSTPECVFTFEPGWSLAAGRLPPRLAGTPPVVDSYAHQLLGVVSTGERFSNSAAAFGSSQQSLGVLEHCSYILLGERGRRQLSPTMLERLNATHTPVQLSGLEVWQLEPARPQAP